ncbi:hypothetical protein GALMADRAFT_213516 [Galerina marginata CBS 339.88]|uniref:Uncharacterized protein n=1 Tax=Galerina marginata (strain CBS 339.88) TaxID=685588 RepID=A0A067SZ81_GALM3|nr:hypothetical protein GALMADRAFT_213516 [Galerina marginata CBS 339.88]
MTVTEIRQESRRVRSASTEVQQGGLQGRKDDGGDRNTAGKPQKWVLREPGCANIQGSGSQPKHAAFQFPPLDEIIQSLNESVKGHSTDTTVGPSLHFPEAQTQATMIFKGVNPSASPPAAPTIDPKLLSVAQPPEQVMNMDTDAPDSTPSAPQESTSAAVASGSPDNTAIQSSDSCKSTPAETVSEVVWPAFGQRAFTGVDAKTIEDIHSTLAMRENHLLVIHEAEFNLCLPQQRTMDDIRAQISFIDRGYRYVNDAEIRLEELRQVVLKIEADSEAKATRKVLLDQRRRLTKEKESLLKVMADKANAEVMLKVTDIVKQLIELDQVLNLPRATKTTKSSNAEKKGGKRLESVGTGDDIGNFKSDPDERKAVEGFNNMTLEQKTDMAAKARASIHAFMKSGSNSDLNVGHHQELRVLQGLLPEESLRSTKLAIAIHTTSAKNTVCRFHKRHQKTRIHDSVGMNVVEGVGYPAAYGSLQDPVVPPDGFMNCGCLIEDVLYDFYFWKTWTATGRRPDLANRSESLKYDILPPRIRAFVVDMFKKFTRLTLNDLYGCYGMSRTAREDTLAMVSAKRLIEGWQKSTGVGVTFELHGNSSEAKVEDVGDN